jgi:hypothetical protein
MKTNTFRLLAITISTAFLVSCGGNDTNEANDNTVVSDTIVEVETEQQVDYALPSPLRVANMFKRAGLPFNSSLMNSPKNIEKYVSKDVQKLNFGVYAADLAYSALNNQNQDAIYYLQSLSNLSEKMWHTNIFSSVGILNRFEKNIGNEDSLINVLTDLQMQLDGYLDENGLSHNAVLIFSGAWIETMYIGSQVLEKEPNEKLNSILAEQVGVLDNLLGLAAQYKEDVPEDLTKDLEKISNHFDKFRVEGDDSDDETEENMSFSVEELNALAKDITEIRTKIING